MSGPSRKQLRVIEGERVNPLAQGHIVVDVYACQQKREHRQPFSRPLHTDKCRRSPFPRGECAASATVLQAWSCQRNVPAQQPRTPSEFGRHSVALRRNAGGSLTVHPVSTVRLEGNDNDPDCARASTSTDRSTAASAASFNPVALQTAKVVLASWVGSVSSRRCRQTSTTRSLRRLGRDASRWFGLRQC